ncbi:lipopolysaccharide biosynthesis protein [Spirosoma koreense]
MSNRAPKRRSIALPSPSLLVLTSGQAVSALAGLVYGKLTALYIRPDVWGAYSLLFAGLTLFQGLCLAPTVQAFKVALTQFPHRQTIRFYGWLLMVIYGVGAPLLGLAAAFCCPNTYVGLIWLATIGQGVCQLGWSYLNATGRHKHYALMQMGYALGTVAGFVGIVLVLADHSITGLWLAAASTNIGFAFLSTWYLSRKCKEETYEPTANADFSALWRTYHQYMYPLISLAFWGWLINYADRYLIRLFMTETDVGQYAMAYSLGAKLVLLVGPVLAFLSPKVLRLRATGQPAEQANALIRPYLIRYGWLAGIGCLTFFIGHREISRLLLSDRYAPAFLVGPIVATGYLFLTSVHLLELKWYTFGQTRFVLGHHLLGTLLNIGLNLLLIPQLGILGAALATLLGFAGQFLLALYLFSFTPSSNP